VRVLTARWILPVCRPPINGGWIRIRNGVIVEMGAGAVDSAAEDLGDVALLPGLVNAHTHLEFSDRKRPVGTPGIALSQWIGQVITARGESGPIDRNSAIALGIRESAAAGVRLIGEITTPPARYPADRESPELVTFAEVLGLSPERGDERLRAAVAWNQAHQEGAWSPHAPYSTSRECIEACVAQAVGSNRPIAIHLAESPEERQLLEAGSGPLAQALLELGVWRDDAFPWRRDALAQLIDWLSRCPQALLVHGNDLRDSEIARIAPHRQMTVVHCPRTHAFFGYPAHPLQRLLAAGIRVALGTDSRASNPDLNLWSEVQYLLRHRCDLDPLAVIRMGTLSGGEALGKPMVGRLAIGCRPGFGIVACPATKLDHLYECLSQNTYSPRRI
jgi:cytosine/adenosine deaminase-related metal-dependent hydrolase